MSYVEFSVYKSIAKYILTHIYFEVNTDDFYWFLKLIAYKSMIRKKSMQKNLFFIESSKISNKLIKSDPHFS